jgi:hypothetical protein
VAHTTEELALLCDRHWSEARQHLLDGDFDQWFRARNRHDLVAKARSAKLVDGADAALEAFLQRLNPRLTAPTLVVEPPALDFGRVTRGGTLVRHLRLRNDGRGYAQATLSSSIPWLSFEPSRIGCLSGANADVKAKLDATMLPLRREHQGIITCTPARGVRVSIPVTAELSLVREGLRRLGAAAAGLGRLMAQGAWRGWGLWVRTFRSLLRSRYGLWIVGIEAVLLVAAMFALWWMWRGSLPSLDGLPLALVLILPAALLAVYFLPSIIFVTAAVLWEMIRALADRATAPHR